jgi:hypothetical protein
VVASSTGWHLRAGWRGAVIIARTGALLIVVVVEPNFTLGPPTDQAVAFVAGLSIVLPVVTRSNVDQETFTP